MWVGEGHVMLRCSGLGRVLGEQDFEVYEVVEMGNIWCVESLLFLLRLGEPFEERETVAEPTPGGS